jgi:tetratricopeptide (TPR) repeat protein
MTTESKSLVGTRLGGLLLECELGSGGFGTVFRGKPDVGLPRAVKVLRDRALAGALRREAETLLALRHPRIVELVHADLSGDAPFVVMELVEGPALSERLPMDGEAARMTCRGILEGLAFAHAKGVAHLDLKPTNVLLAPDGPKIADFGLARAVSAVDGPLAHSQSASSGSMKGTLAYMAPEIKEGRPGDLRADVYSFGVLLAQVLTGKLPQPGDTLDELMGRSSPAWAQAIFARSYCRYEKRLANASEALAILDSGAPTRDSGRLAAPVSSSGPRKIPCPYCKEEIAADAIKCRFCGSRLDEAKPLSARTGAGMCAVHLEQPAIGACIGCGGMFCGSCLSPVKGKNYCRTCVGELVDAKQREAERAQEQVEREKDRAAKGSGAPNIVVTTTGGGAAAGGGGGGSSSSSSSAAAAAAASSGGGRVFGLGVVGLPVRLLNPVRATLLSFLWPGLGHAYIGRPVRGVLIGLAGLLAVLPLAILVFHVFGIGDDDPGAGTVFGLLVFSLPWLGSASSALDSSRRVNYERVLQAARTGLSVELDSWWPLSKAVTTPIPDWVIEKPTPTHQETVSAPVGRAIEIPPAGPVAALLQGLSGAGPRTEVLDIEPGRVRPENRCGSCGYVWVPRGRDLSAQCPQCGSGNVQVKVLERPKPPKKPPEPTSPGSVLLTVGLLTIGVGSGYLVHATSARQKRAEAERLVASGKQAFESRRWEEAYTTLERAAQGNPEGPSLGAQIQEARQHHREQLVAEAEKSAATGDLDGAVATLERATGVSPTPELTAKVQKAKYASGRKALDARRFDRAFELLNAIRSYEDAATLADSAKVELDYAEAEKLLAQADAAVKRGAAEDALKLLDRAEPKAAKTPPGKPTLNERIAAVRASVLGPLYDQANGAVANGDLEKALDLFRRLGTYKDAPGRVRELEARVAKKKADAEFTAVESAIKAGELEPAETLLANLAKKYAGQKPTPEITERLRSLADAWEKAWTASLTPIDGRLAQAAGATLQEDVRARILSELPTAYTPLQRKNYFDTAEGKEKLEQRTKEHEAEIAALVGRRYVMRWHGLSTYDLKKNAFNSNLGMYGGAFGAAVAKNHEAADYHRSVVNGVWFTNASGFLTPVARKNRSDAGKWLRIRCDETVAGTIEPARSRVEIELTFKLARDTKTVAGPGSPNMVCPVAISERVRLIDPSSQDPTRRVLLSLAPEAVAAKAVQPDTEGGKSDDDDDE